MTTQIQKADNYTTIKMAFEKHADQVGKAAAGDFNVARGIAIALSSIKKTPQLLACSASSLLLAVQEATKLGLTVGGTMGEVHLVPYGAEAVPVIGYRGYASLMRRGGEISVIRAVCVHAKDHFRYTEGFEPTIEHEPSLEADQGPLTHVYAVAKWKASGDYQFVILAKPEVMRAREASKNKAGWDAHPEAYWQKTAIRRLAKLTPLTEETEAAIDADDRRSFDVDSTAVEVAQESAQTSVKASMAAKRTRNLRIQEGSINGEPGIEFHGELTPAGEPPADVVLPTEDKK